MKGRSHTGCGVFFKRIAVFGRGAAFLFAAPFFLPLFLACSHSEPSIEFGFLELVYYQGERGPEERFSFFVIPRDDDGVENLEELRLYHDREGLCWTLTGEDWILHDEENRTWIGSRSIAMAAGEVLPRGQFRAVLVNKGGEKSERTFTFDAPEGSRFPFPSLEIREAQYRVESRYPENKLIAYDSQGRPVQTLPLGEFSGSVASLNLSSQTRAIALWAEDREYSTGALTEPVSVR
ncbi:MAG: hypothetical protein LBI94_05310 [Treponema sp.]|nr:hypothetical protein [Treponema sp.]